MPCTDLTGDEKTICEQNKLIDEYGSYLELKGDDELKKYYINRRKTYYENDALERQSSLITSLFYMYFILLIIYVVLIVYKGRYTERSTIIFVLFAVFFPFIMRFFVISFLVSLTGLIWRNIPKNHYVYF
jgi:hypothetical protein